MAEIKKLLDDAIETEINNLNSASDTDEKSEVIKNLAALHKLRIEEIKTETEIEEKSERMRFWPTFTNPVGIISSMNGTRFVTGSKICLILS